MKKLLLFPLIYKFTLVFILLSLVLPFSILIIINHGINFPRDIATTILVSLFLFLIVGRNIELKGVKKIITIAVTFVTGIFSPFIITVLILLSPAQQELDRIWFGICIPELRRHYNLKDKEQFRLGPVDKERNSKWWFQLLECEENVSQGKGPIFSDNPPAFLPVK